MIVSLADYLPKPDWARACAMARMLDAAEIARLEAKSAQLRAWRNRPREPKPEQRELCW
jgi:hypothetical protein